MNSIEEVNRSVLNENIDITQQIEGVSSGTITLPESSYKTDELNKITLELFMNKTNYVKYLSKNDPKKFEEHMKFCYFTSKKITTDSSIYLIIQ